jgi:hypothetical protein
MELLALPGACSTPTLAADAQGVLYLAFAYAEADLAEIRFMRFTWRSPFGKARRIVGSSGDPAAPAIAVSRDGVAHVLWIDRPRIANLPQRIWFARFNPDSGLTDAMPLTRAPAQSQTAITADTDSAGTLHTVWQVSGPGTYELQYQRRPRSTQPSPRDTVIERQSGPFQAPQLSVDRRGGLHLVYDGSSGGVNQVRYKRWRVTHGWDQIATDVSDGVANGIAQPAVMPTTPDEVVVAFSAFSSSGAQFLIRRRGEVPQLLAVVPSLPTPELTFTVGPNPRPAGEPLRFELQAVPRDPWVDVYDVAGRRLQSVALENRGAVWAAELSHSVLDRWPAGVYFARLRSSAGPAVRWVMRR